jgi:hypothetical protein
MMSFHTFARMGFTRLGFARLGLVIGLLALDIPGSAVSAAMPTPAIQPPALVEPARSILRDLFRDDGGDDFVHDDHYDWNDYRNATSRKDRIRDFYEMQRQDQKSYWKQQKEIQKDMIKRQRGW